MRRASCFVRYVAVWAAVALLSCHAATHAQDGNDQAIAPELRKLMQSQEADPAARAAAKLPLQMRTAYAVGGLENCETVLSISNFSKKETTVEVEFFTGFNFFQRGIAQLTLKPGETGEIATTSTVPPFVINAVRDSSVAFEGYANIHAETPDLGAHCHMVYSSRNDRSYQSIKVFRARDGQVRQQGD